MLCPDIPSGITYKTKGAADAKRAQVFTKIAREMMVAVKEGGSGDPALTPALPRLLQG